MEIRVLVAMEDEYRAYREVLAAGFEAIRPAARVATTVPSDVEEERARFDPQVVISSGPGSPGADGPAAWIEIAANPSRLATVRFSGRRSEQIDSSFDGLLAVIDRVGRDGGAEGEPTSDEAPSPD